jgi:PASTA domain-containing protein
MNFLGGSLPNVMFLIGVLAIGLGLGIELKLVPLSKEIDKTGRIGAMVVGALLVAGSLYIYLNPALTNPNQTAPATANGALTPVQATPATNAQLIAAAPAVPTAVSLPAAAPVPTAAPIVVPSVVPSATPAPTATPIPTAVPPTPIPPVTVPDLHNLSEKEAQGALSAVGLRAHKVDKCTGSDQGDEKGKKHSVQCQNPAANAAVPLGTTVEYVVR